MHPNLLRLAADLAQRGEPFALASVVRREAPSSAHIGDAALITAGGTFHGWLGGSCTQPTAVTEALAALRDGKPRLIALSSDPQSARRPGVTVLPMTCHSGGSVDLFIEPVLPAPRLVVFGTSPTSQAVVRMGVVLGYTVEAVDPAADRATFPDAHRVVTDVRAADLVERAGRDPERLFIVVAGLGDDDAESVAAALELNPWYIGVVASRRRMAQLREALSALGIDTERLDRIDSPAGLDIGAVTPAEIAVSILATIVQRDRGRRSSEPDVTKRDEPAATSATTPRRDPVCGMMVAPAATKHRADVDGVTYYFCCAGCRSAFLEDPHKYLATTSSGREAGE